MTRAGGWQEGGWWVGQGCHGASAVESHKVVLRYPDPADRRRIRVSLTEKGLNLKAMRDYLASLP